jgi:hypothetical protein
MFARVAPLTCTALLSLVIAGSVGAAAERRPSVNFRSVPANAYPGDTVSATIAVRPATARCTLTVTYRNSEKQAGLRSVRASGGRAKWVWQIPEDAVAGTAKLRASCGRAGSATRSLSIVGAIIPAKIAVEQTGFSIRPGRTTGAKLSFGVILANESPNQDAFDLTVLVNFVDDRNFLWGSKTSRIAGLAAGSRYALGGFITFSGPLAPPVTKLEVTVQIGGRAPASRRPNWLASIPDLANTRIFPSREPEWVGGVDGEVINDDPRFYLDSTGFSAVVFDSAGAILGGGTGTSRISMPPGARSVFILSSGFDAMATIRATSSMISPIPTYRQPGS